MTPPPALVPRNYYRLPWSLNDNAISWLEVTTSCNLACSGCYRTKSDGHKTLQEIQEDLDVFQRNRNSDCMSIAGGDPLVHPKIVEITELVKAGGWKPILNTNGLALTPELLTSLKRAGVSGFTFHIDTSQTRRDSPVDTEEGHNALRQRLAEMVAQAGDISCAFNQTVTSDTLDQIPAVVRWAKERPDIVHGVVFILYREPELLGDFDFFANGKQVRLRDSYEESQAWRGKSKVKAADVVDKIREVEPLYEPNSYLNGTQEPESTKWLLATRVASGRKTFGYTTPKFMELAQTFNHFFRGKWLSYSGPSVLAGGKSAVLGTSLFDRGMRRVAWRWFKSSILKPTAFLEKVHLQTFTIIQPIDVLADGRADMCDGCPDITVHKGKMYWSCRLEEIKDHGCFVTAVPRCRTVKEQLPSAREALET